MSVKQHCGGQSGQLRASGIKIGGGALVEIASLMRNLLIRNVEARRENYAVVGSRVSLGRPGQARRGGLGRRRQSDKTLIHTEAHPKNMLSWVRLGPPGSG